MVWSRGRRVAAATVVMGMAASLAVSAGAAADGVDPVYSATLALSNAAMRCEPWPVFEDGEWTVAQGAGPSAGVFTFTSSVGNFDDSLDDGDYRLIFTSGDTSIDGIGYRVDGSGDSPGFPLPDGDDGSVNAAWALHTGSTPPPSIGVRLIGLDESSEWVQVYAGNIPVVDNCVTPTQEIGAPEELTIDGAGPVLSGRTAYVDAPAQFSAAASAWGGQTAGRWLCACTIDFEVSLSVDGEVVSTTTSQQPAGMWIDIPPNSVGKTAVVTITASPSGTGPWDEFWTPVTIASTPVVIGAPPPLTGTLHLYSADPTTASPPAGDLACTPAGTLVVGSQLWVSPWKGNWQLSGGTLVCGAYRDLSAESDTAPATDVSWYADGVPIAASGNPLTITADLCGKVITAKQTWVSPRHSAAQLTSVASQPVYCTLAMTPGTPKIVGTAKVGGSLTVDVSAWNPSSATFTYQWYQTINSAGDTIPIAGATGPQFTPTTAQAGRTVFVGVTGSANGYASAWVLSQEVTIAASAPSAPRSLKATAKSKSVALTWTAPAATGGSAITGYRVYRSTNGSTWTSLGTITARSFTAKSLTNGKKYWFRAVAINAKGSSVASNTVTAVPRTKASAPRSLKATAKVKSVSLTWTAPKSTGGAAITGYRVYRSTNGTSFTLVKTVKTRSATVTGLTKGKKYWFKVVAVNSAGASPASSKVSVRPR